jgi:membrane-bound metal-dependent hydrolase YbcI (DUF457 family)
MKWYTYISIGLVLYLGLLLIFQTDTELISLGLLILGSMLPIILEDMFLRSFEESHTLFLIIPFTLIGILNWKWVFAIGTGYLSHLLIDTLSFDNPPLLYPLNKKRFSALNNKRKIQEGSNREKSLFIILLTLIFILLIPTMHLEGLCDLTLDYHSTPEEKNETTTQNTSTTQNTTYHDKITKQVDLNIQLYGDQEKKLTIDDGKGNVTTIKVENIPKNTT